MDMVQRYVCCMTEFNWIDVVPTTAILISYTLVQVRMFIVHSHVHIYYLLLLITTTFLLAYFSSLIVKPCWTGRKEKEFFKIPCVIIIGEQPFVCIYSKKFSKFRTNFFLLPFRILLNNLFAPLSNVGLLVELQLALHEVTW
jgi:hypothetical protein